MPALLLFHRLILRPLLRDRVRTAVAAPAAAHDPIKERLSRVMGRVEEERGQ